MTELCEHKNLLISRHETGQSCILFSKARVSQGFLKIPNAVYPLVPFSRQVCGCNHRWCELLVVLKHAFPEF